MAQYKGIDVSAINGIVDWNAIKSMGIQCAMLRLGFGNDIASQDDSQFARNVSECERLGINWGAYLYSYALNTTDAQSEANHALRMLKGKKPTLPIAFDMEDADGYKSKHGMPTNGTLINICNTFLSTLSNDGYYVSLYANLSWLDNQLNSSTLDRFDKWVAQWNSTCQYTHGFGIWQDSDDLQIKGHIFDDDIFLKDYPTCIKNGGLNGWPKPTAVQASTTIKNATIKAGQKITLSKANLYVSSTATNASGTISGTYYLWDATVTNGRIRITNSTSNVGKTNAVTGWITTSNIK
ncbi:MAG: glycoside hydrolase family 25 protein [Bacillota bacterium]|nr:glycoside hydrolase family 25 protein [Bacillota bacterium]